MGCTLCLCGSCDPNGLIEQKFEANEINLKETNALNAGRLSDHDTESSSSPLQSYTGTLILTAKLLYFVKNCCRSNDGFVIPLKDIKQATLQSRWLGQHRSGHEFLVIEFSDVVIGKDDSIAFMLSSKKIAVWFQTINKTVKPPDGIDLTQLNFDRSHVALESSQSMAV